LPPLLLGVLLFSPEGYYRWHSQDLTKGRGALTRRWASRRCWSDRGASENHSGAPGRLGWTWYQRRFPL